MHSFESSPDLSQSTRGQPPVVPTITEADPAPAPTGVDAVNLPAFGREDDFGPLTAAFQTHSKHQLIFASAGMLLLEVEGSQWFLPPHRAAWISARIRHRISALTRVSLRTVYLSPRFHPASPGACLVFAAPPVAREMILHAMRWGADRHVHDATARAFFTALSALAGEWARDVLPFRLPMARSPELGRAMTYAIEALSGAPSVEEAAKRAGLSTRTLARRFSDEAHTSWRQFLHQARMMRAMELLASPGARVTETAMAVGFDSPGAFTRAFEEFTGEKPKDYRGRRGKNGGGAEG